MTYLFRIYQKCKSPKKNPHCDKNSRFQHHQKRDLPKIGRKKAVLDREASFPAKKPKAQLTVII